MRATHWLVPCLGLVIASSSRGDESKPLAPVPGTFQLTGAWACEGKFRGAEIHKAKFTGAVILGGKWLELDEEDVQPATGYKAKYLIGYDAEQKLLVEFDANNFGAATYTSERGWEKGVLTMTSGLSHDPKATYVANRFRYDASGKDTFSVDWQIRQTATSDWTPADHLSCRRA
jgi:hypothetical protein